MKDPHVEWLRYRLVAADGVRFSDPPPRLVSGPGFRGTLEDGILVCGLREHHPTIREARARVDPYLRAWEIQAGVLEGRPMVGFQFEDARRIDRDPSAGALPPHADRSSGPADTAEPSSAVLTRDHYPGPPEGFAASPDVECMWRRYLWYLEGNCPVEDMAGFCLTVAALRFAGSGRGEAASSLRIQEEVLDRLAELVGPQGNGGPAPAEENLDSQERRWVEQVVLALVRRVGELDAGVSPRGVLGMDAFPPLE